MILKFRTYHKIQENVISETQTIFDNRCGISNNRDKKKSVCDRLITS